MRTSLIVSALLLLCTVLPALAENTDIAICMWYDEKRPGYGEVQETHEDEVNIHELECWNPGEKECKWMRNPLEPRLIDYAESQISNGFMSGHYFEIEGNVRFDVTWMVTPEGTQIVERPSAIPAVQ